ncbi:regulatory protein ArsR [Vulcanisaeta moutnovskia 768-28]|uniref:Regulatory protein ArsR n=1 Tax=Vulcanisaeta moutnovskia (strain 768-28) TaxID=985053 RepID=F0QYJ3_VULM7|nr:ArsR family transcriptional regulator [Vulcanisaeta moutnovskia]ADY01426.1 regulatory protein ArsR [Vulcanisaeta moutnovskia 768-28]
MNAVVKPEIIVTLNGEERRIVPSYDNEYVLMREKDFNVILDNTNLSIILAIISGHDHFVQIMKKTGLQRGKLSRHLRRLLNTGWVIKNGNRYLPSGRIYVAYDVKDVNGEIMLSISMSKGAFIDPFYGLVIINGEPLSNYCSTCPLRQVCVNNVKSLARKYNIELRGAEPSEAYVELFRELIRRDLIKRFRSGWRIVIRR